MSEKVSTPPTNPDDALRAHSYDGIQEFDKRLPNWWLMTLYGAIVFAFAYWAYYQGWNSFSQSATDRLESEMNRITLAAASSSGAQLTDEQLWKMSRDPKLVEAGRATFRTTCVTCHGPEAKGGIGPNLTDNIWIHGGRPQDIILTITTGVPAKGMPTWGPILGRMRILEAASFVLSMHNPPPAEIPVAAP
jgi:cytochrome c oxidase cbb3-type subunit 3